MSTKAQNVKATLTQEVPNGLPEFGTIIAQWTERLFIETSKMREEQFKLYIRPKPWWVPFVVWRAVTRRVLTVTNEVKP